ncbi:MAG TPA: hypothetical protein ENG20_02650 [Methanomicrobia archaeon]|nr:hypothetical protein [Methanomicrobia archaeon]
MKFLRYFIKSLIRNWMILFWGIFFVGFWLFLGAFVWSGSFIDSVKNLEEIYKQKAFLSYTASWYSMCVLMGFSAISTTLAGIIYNSTSALPYLKRFSRLSPEKYYTHSLIGVSLMTLISSFSLLIITVILYGYRLKSPVYPQNILLLSIVSLFGGLFYYSLAFVISIVSIVLKSPRIREFLGFLPLILTYGVGLAQVNMSLNKNLIYASPINCVLSLLSSAYYGSSVSNEITKTSITDPSIHLSNLYLFISLFLWICILSMINIIMLRRVEEMKLEEGRI